MISALKVEEGEFQSEESDLLKTKKKIMKKEIEREWSGWAVREKVRLICWQQKA